MECRAHKFWQHRRLPHMPPNPQKLYNSLSKDVEATTPAVDTMIRRLLPAGRVPHVCIVGAGVAGLRCADLLSMRGVKVTLLEARNRIGGRIHQSNQLGRLVDLGPNWIHGTERSPILDLANETSTVTLNPEAAGSSAAVDQLGHTMPEAKVKEHNELMWSVIDSAFKYSKEESASIPQDRSLYGFFQTKLKEKSLDRASSEIVLQMARIWGDFIGDPIEKQSLKYLWLEDCIDGENLFVASTYKAILDRIAESALANIDLHLSTKVTKIISNPNLSTDHPLGITVSTNTDDAPFLYDEVVMTVPLGYLQRNLSTFSPPLPTPLSDAISQGSYGRLEKVYVTFPTAYWSQATSDGTQKPFFTHFLHPTYALKHNPKAWNMNCASLAELPGDASQPTLLFYMHGECAEHITFLANGLDPNSQEYYDRLQPFFEPYYSRLPNYSSSSEDCIPKGYLATNWQHDEFAGYGSYANFQVSHGEGKVLLDKNIETIRNGAAERHIWFAGEHTAPFEALGTVTGAYWSGEHVAQRILAVYGMLDKEGITGKSQSSVSDGNYKGADSSNIEINGIAPGAGVVGL